MTKSLRVLHIEDVQSDAELVELALIKANLKFEKLRVENSKDFRKALTEFKPDIIISDHSLPSFNSHEALEIYHEFGLKIPFILVTGTMSDEFAADIIKRGADDYVLKDRLKRLPIAMNASLEKYRLVKEKEDSLNDVILNEKRYRALIENNTDAVVILTKEGRAIYASPSVKRVLGYTEQETLKLNLYELVYPGDIEKVTQRMEVCFNNPGKTIQGHTGRVRHKNGNWVWLESTITNLLDDPAVNGIVDNFRDITEKKHAEEKLVHANRLYAFISQINQTIIHVKDERSVFMETCRIAIKVGKFKAAWIGMFDETGRKINVEYGFGIFLEDSKKFKNVPYEDVTSQLHVLNTRTPYVCNDIQKADEIGWKPFAEARGYCSFMVSPIRKSGKIIGTFNVYSSEADFFNIQEMSLLEEATTDISFALDIFEKEKLKAQADLKLKESEQRLKQAQAIAHIGSWELNFSTGIALWSEEALSIYGLPTDQAEQPHDVWSSFIHPDDLESVLKITKKAEENFSEAAFFHRIIKRDRSVRYIYSQTQYNFDSEGKPVGLNGVAHDITDRKKSEEALRKSETDLQTIFDSTSEGFILLDLNGTIRSFNNKSKDIILLNVEKNIEVGTSIFDYIHESRKEDYKGAIEKVLNGETLQYDQAYERENGEVRWFNFMILPVKNNGKVEAICITSTDITHRIQSQKLLKESQSNLKAVINNTDAHIYSLDTNFRYLTFNQSLQDVMRNRYGCEIKEGDIVFDFLKKIDPLEAVEWQKIYSEALLGKTIRFEKEFKLLNNYTYTSFSIYPIWENNTVIGLSCFARDITKQKEEEKYNKKITADLIQRNKDLEQFSYIVSHNLRAPVVNILGLTNLLIEKAVVNKEREQTEKFLYTATSQLDNVIKDLNNVLVVQREINEKKEIVVFSKLVENIMSSIQNLVEKENVTITIDFAEVASMLTLKGHLYSIFYNLISNSIKYSQPGKNPVISISSEKKPEKICLIFKDNGMGIDLEKYGDSVFGLYKRFHFEVEGKGMGLFMTKTQVETLGGRISVASEVNKGTEFRIEFED